jgi:hypothetical protein
MLSKGVLAESTSPICNININAPNCCQQAKDHLEQGPKFPKVDIQDLGLYYPQEHPIGYNL